VPQAPMGLGLGAWEGIMGSGFPLPTGGLWRGPPEKIFRIFWLKIPYFDASDTFISQIIRQ